MSADTKGKFRIAPVEDRLAEWDALVRASKQGTVFSLSQYLSAAGRPYVLYFIFRGNEIKAGVSLIVSDDGRRGVLDDFVIYNGLLFRSDPIQKKAKARFERFEIAEFVLAELDGAFDSVAMALHPACEDIRPFLWRNYNDSGAGRRYRAEPRYTSMLDISELFLRRAEQATELYQALDHVRQRDIRKARTDGVSVREDSCVDLFIQYYAALMASQGHPPAPVKLERMRKLVDSLLSNGLARLFAAVNKAGNVSYITIFTLYENHACYLFGAGDSSSMTRYDGTICLWEAFQQLAALGIRDVDLEGVNSPRRGWFKLGFGGDLRLYFEVSNAAHE